MTEAQISAFLRLPVEKVDLLVVVVILICFMCLVAYAQEITAGR